MPFDPYFSSSYVPDNSKERKVAKAKQFQRRIWSRKLKGAAASPERCGDQFFPEHGKGPYVIGQGGPARHGYRRPYRKWDKGKR